MENITYIYELSKNGIPFYIGKTISHIVRKHYHELTYGKDITFTIIDQTDGDIIQRYWIFDGAGEAFDPNTQTWIPVTSESVPVFDPNVHTIKFRYQYPGVYQPSLLILFESQNLKRAYLTESITVN